MPTVLHSRPLPGGQQVLVVETTPPNICRWYKSRRLDVVLTSAEPYTRVTGRSVLRPLLRETFVDVRSESARDFYEHVIDNFVRAAETFAADMTAVPQTPLADAPSASHELTIDDINAMGLAAPRSAS